mmetsp:Transcript_8666/g.22416  ORF Transcript_8666/g.22416 Transcript_8666/m.22416 type:complete len:344 (-) Transcript_8666:35-1066(-)
MGAYADLKDLGDATHRSREKCLTHTVAVMTVFMLGGFAACAYYMAELHNDIHSLQINANGNWTETLITLAPMVENDHAELVRIDTELGQLSNQAGATQGAVANNSAVINQVAAQVAANTANITAINASVSPVQAQVQSNQDAIAALQGNVSAAIATLSTLSESLNMTDDDVSDLRDGLSALNSSLKGLVTTVGGNTDQINTLNNEVGQLQSLQKAVGGFQHDLDTLNVTIASVQNATDSALGNITGQITNAVKVANGVQTALQSKLSNATLTGTAVTAPKGQNVIQCTAPTGVPVGISCSCASGPANATLKFRNWNTVECDCKDSVTSFTAFCIDVVTSTKLA